MTSDPPCACQGSWQTCNCTELHHARFHDTRYDLEHLCAGVIKELPRSSATRLYAERILAAMNVTLRRRRKR